MPSFETAQRLRIYIGESDTCQHRPLFEVLIKRAHEDGLAGATVFRSPMGFGANSQIHTAKVLNLSTDLPIVVEIIDAEAKILAFLETIEPLVTKGMATLENVSVAHFSKP